MPRYCAFFFAAMIFAAHAFDAVTPGRALEFPRDRGAHPAYRIEWWYATGHLDTERGAMGFQVTFFRVRNARADSQPGRFAPRQVLFAHAALADVARERFHHDQRVARVLEPIVEARTDETSVRIDDWSFAREHGSYRARIPADDFALDLELTPTQEVLLEGERGFSRKGPGASQASYYYSEPQLAVHGTVRTAAGSIEARGVAWLDHEWSSELLAPGAVGWDWLGANLDGGGALMAFRIRAGDGRVLWSSATWRPPRGPAVTFAPADVAFVPQRTWRSPASGTQYPVVMELRVGNREFRIEPLMDDQELDARATTGTLYWEGAVRIDGSDGSRGRGYLELTGYAGALAL